MYSQDSFFDLTPMGQVGLACISLTLFVCMVWLSGHLLTRLNWIGRIAGALLLFWLFVWLSPQVYYMYYRMIIPDLPLQWVIWPPAPAREPILMLLFSFRPNLSAHGQGLLGWAMILAPFVFGRSRKD